jgi:protein-ribulosamine 3-kinase
LEQILLPVASSHSATPISAVRAARLVRPISSDCAGSDLDCNAPVRSRAGLTLPAGAMGAGGRGGTVAGASMTQKRDGDQPENPARWFRVATKPLRAAVEGVVSAHLGRPWRIEAVRDMADYASHPSAIMSDGAYGVFAKFSDAVDGRRQFEIELAGLRLLADRAGALIPTPLGILSVPGGEVLVLEAVRAVERAPRHLREIGRTLARIHRVQGERFGLETDGYFGPVFQENRPLDDWPAFYAERRLGPALRLAVDAGHLPPAVVRRVERLIARLPGLCGPAVAPALLHGDAQQNNFISTDAGAVVIDPAIYYGHPEMDLAAVGYWQPAPEEVYDGYREIGAIDPGFRERRGLWRAWAYLAAVAVEGRIHLGRLEGALRPYV